MELKQYYDLLPNCFLARLYIARGSLAWSRVTWVWFSLPAVLANPCWSQALSGSESTTLLQTALPSPSWSNGARGTSSLNYKPVQGGNCRGKEDFYTCSGFKDQGRLFDYK